MKIETIWTQNEGDSVLFTLRRKYGELAPRTLLKKAVRDRVEQLRRLEQMKRAMWRPKRRGMIR